MAGMKMTIYVPSVGGSTIDTLRGFMDSTDPTLNGEKKSLEEVILVKPNAFIDAFFPDEEIDSTYRQIVQKAVEGGISIQVVTHYYLDPKLKGTAQGKENSLGPDNVYCDLPSNRGEIWIFKTNISQLKQYDSIYIASFPDFIGKLDRNSLSEAVEGFPEPEFPLTINRKKLRYYLDFAGKGILEKLGMVGGFCYPCPSNVLVTESNLDVQIVLDADSIIEHKKQLEFKADMPINFSKTLLPNQGASFQINYSQLYELLNEIFPNKVKVAGLYGRSH